jgi:translation initiation factor IF-2
VYVSKVRVYELAKETGLPNKEVIRRLGDLGVEAKSHSSTVENVDAGMFRDSLGKQREAKKRDQEERARREAEEYDLSNVRKDAAQASARRILPPHLRKQQEQAAQAEQPAAQTRRFRAPTTPFRPGESSGVSVGGDVGQGVEDGPAQPGTTPQPVSGQPAETAPPPAASAPDQVAGPDEVGLPETVASPGEVGEEPVSGQERSGHEAGAADAARAGVVRAAPTPEQQAAERARAEQARGEQARAAQRAPQQRREQAPAERGEDEIVGTPGVPRPGTPPRPGQPTVPRRPASPMSSAATGTPVEPRRRVEHNLPREGSGKRAIPPPIKAAPKGGPSSRPAPRPGGGPGAPGAPGAGRPKKGKKGKRRKEPTPQEQFEEQARRKQQRSGPVQAQTDGPVDVVPGITVGEFAKLIGVNATDIVRVLFGMGEMITVTQSMNEDLIGIVGDEMGAEVNFVTPEDLEFAEEATDTEEDLATRAPVVTIMGHVDHGKTLLLDAIRSTDVVSGEAGGITQHIGAYQISRNDRKITFIDTPGHEAFTQMRARGAGVTDVAILVVAADDGVKPQTVEAISHIREADVPIIVAVNKVDKENADPLRVRTQLTEHELVAEEFGGQTTMVDVSAKTGQNLEDLLEMVLLQADVAELRANPERRARGTVIEANLDRGRGAVATVLVQNGTLQVGDNLVAGIADCKVRAMFDDQGKPVEGAGPSQPVEVLGWNDVPNAGDEFRVVADERTARDIAANRAARERRLELANRKTISLEDLSGAIAEGQLQSLNLIIKGDVAGSVEAVADALNKLDMEDVRVRIVHKAVGAVNENDVSLAETSDAIIIAFNVRPEANARAAIDASGVDLRQYSVIYKAVEDIERAVKGLLSPEFEEVVEARAEVREVFRVPRAGFVFGSYVTEGTLRRGGSVRVIRDGVVVADDRISSLRRFKDDVTEVATGYECGVGLDRFADIKVGDEFEMYAEREIERT